MARQAGVNDYVVARKGPKIYMENIITTEVDSITTDHIQTLCIGQREIDLIKGKRVLIVDDVISTGESLRSIENLVERAGGNIIGKMAVFAAPLLTEMILFSLKNFRYLIRTEALKNRIYVFIYTFYLHYIRCGYKLERTSCARVEGI